jgi:hypothetical protein
MSKKSQPIFIVSSGRSGTTLLRGMLNASNQIFIPHESWFLGWAYPYYHQKTHFSKQDYQQIVRFFKKTSEADGWGMQEDYLLTCLRELAPQNFAEVNSVIYEAGLRQQGLENLQWAIKAPILIFSLEKIFRLFPEAKVIHIVRDGRDVHLSYKRIHQSGGFKFGPKGVITSAFYWVDGLRCIEWIQRIQNKQMVYELRYEDLLNCPEDELLKLCFFLGIEYSQSMYESYHLSERNYNLVLDEQKKTYHKKITEGLDSRNKEKYLREMPKFARFIFELIAAPYLKKYDYPLEFPWLNTHFLKPLRDFAYFGSRNFNSVRYRIRAHRVYKKFVLSAYNE